jgi:hypothetical protein
MDIMIRSVAILIVLIVPLAPVYGHSYGADQTDWSGGDGVPGPVAGWGNTFESATNINWSEAPGDLLLNRASTENVIADSIDNAESICVADIDDDGDMDVVAAVGTTCTWWENADGSGSSWVEHIVYTGSYTAHCVNTGDLDGDGDLDIMWTYGVFFSAGYWFENADGSGTSWNTRSSFGAYYLRAADIDGDDDADIVGATLGNTVLYWENTDGTGLSWTQHTIDDAFDGSISVYIADIDADNNLDVVAAALSGNEVAWWQNDGSSPPVWTKVSVDASFTGARTVFADDIDNDGDADIVAGALDGHETAWWANVDGSGMTWNKEIISDDAEVNSVCSADIDNDGDGDVFGARNSENSIVLYENVDGLGTTWNPRNVKDGASGGLYIEIADIDGDDHPEAVGSLRSETGSGALLWWEVSGYQTSGELVSSILDTGDSCEWGTIDWTDDVPEGGTVKFQIRASNSWGVMGSWSNDITTHPFELEGFLEDGLRYVQYKAILETTDAFVTPTLHDVSINWGYTGIGLTYFSAESAADGIDVSWDCADELAGFNLYRSAAGDAKKISSRDRVNAELITGESPYAYLDAAVEKGVTYNYWLEAVDTGGKTETFGPVGCTWLGVLPTTYALYQSRPNPASGTATIAFDLPEDTDVTLTVYDLSGRKVITPVDTPLPVGRHEAAVSGLAPGVYVYKLEAGDYAAARKMVIVE